MAAVKSRLGSIIADLVWERTELWFDRIVARKHVAGVDAVYGYEHGCLETFRRTKARGGVCIYDIPITHHATTSHWLAQEYANYPELLTDYDRHRLRVAPRRNRRKDKELALADRVVVPSDFVADSVIAAGVPREKIWTIPFGAPPVDTSGRKLVNGRFVFIMAGSLSVRKGAHYVLKAWRTLAPPPDVELWLVGTWQLPDRLREGLPGKVWISPPLPRWELFELFDRANVFVFPTLAEGLALTPLEAMARGLPVITTPNSGEGIFIRNGENGWMIPPCNADALATAMARCYQDSAGVEEAGKKAAEKMASWQWSEYRAMMRRAISEYLQSTCGRDS